MLKTQCNPYLTEQFPLILPDDVLTHAKLVLQQMEILNFIEFLFNYILKTFNYIGLIFNILILLQLLILLKCRGSGICILRIFQSIYLRQSKCNILYNYTILYHMVYDYRYLIYKFAQENNY